jgi:hypothetical protein
VITLGPDCEASGARIAVETKEDGSYDLARSVEEIRTACANRDADVGLFIHSRKTAPAGLKPLARYGNEVVITWDAEDEATDVLLSGALMICKALSVRARITNKILVADFDALEKSIREVERQAGYLDEIKTSSVTIKNGAEKILGRVESMRTAVAKQIEILDAQIDAIKNSAVRSESTSLNR